VTEDLSVRSAFNTAVSTLMEFTNTLYAESESVADTALVQAEEALVLLLAPFAPHLADELWHQLGHDTSVHIEAWPSYDPAWLVEEEIQIAIQVNGKVRGRLVVSKEATAQELIELALAHDQVAAHVAGREVVKVVPIPGRLVNVVVR
jgi:leucyl-tRNA synthetase